MKKALIQDFELNHRDIRLDCHSYGKNGQILMLQTLLAYTRKNRKTYEQTDGLQPKPACNDRQCAETVLPTLTIAYLRRLITARSCLYKQFDQTH